MTLIPSSERLFWISRVPAPTKSAPGGVAVSEVLGPRITPGVVMASLIGSRPLSGRSETERVLMLSDTLASSVLMARAIASTATVCVTAPIAREKSVRTDWLMLSCTPVLVAFAKPGCSTVMLYTPTRANSKE